MLSFRQYQSEGKKSWDEIRKEKIGEYMLIGILAFLGSVFVRFWLLWIFYPNIDWLSSLHVVNIKYEAALKNGLKLFLALIIMF